ncbi:Uncharacterised protein [Bordetella pertussis]|nr:Uncharacterised protein [Bordetella pertussis]
MTPAGAVATITATAPSRRDVHRAAATVHPISTRSGATSTIA